MVRFMQDALMAYFDGEKNAGLVLAAIGLAVFMAAALLFPAKWGLRSFAVTLAVFALLEIAVGVGLYVRTGPQVGALLARMEPDAAGTFAEERARMARIQRNFVALQYTWLAVVTVAALIAVTQKSRLWLSGIALGVLWNAALFLAFDLVAERRGAAYLAAIAERGGRV